MPCCQPKSYPALIGKALVLDAEPFIDMIDDDNPWVEGLFMIVLLGLATGFARLIGGLLLTISLPRSDAIWGTLSQAWGQITTQLPFLPQAAENGSLLRGIWETYLITSGFGGGWARLLVLIAVPATLIVAWLSYGIVGHFVARSVGGTGSLNETLGACALTAAPFALLLVTIVPFVSVSSLLLRVWAHLIAYRGLQVAHDLPWQKAGLDFTDSSGGACVGYADFRALCWCDAGRRRCVKMLQFERHRWLPRNEQISDAAQLRIYEALAGDEADRFEAEGQPLITVQQSIGLIVAHRLDRRNPSLLCQLDHGNEPGRLRADDATRLDAANGKQPRAGHAERCDHQCPSDFGRHGAGRTGMACSLAQCARDLARRRAFVLILLAGLWAWCLVNGQTLWCRDDITTVFLGNRHCLCAADLAGIGTDSDLGYPRYDCRP